jgi:hypothetical protein
MGEFFLFAFPCFLFLSENGLLTGVMVVERVLYVWYCLKEV